MKFGKWIKMPDILTDSHIYEGPENAKWIWAWEYCRVQAKKYFTLRSNISSAEIYLLCDNIFDVYINGIQIASEVKRLSCNIQDKLLDGENILAVRAYQTDEPERFLSAIRGGITVLYENGKKEEILTDGSWKNLRLCDFNEGTEPDGWQTKPLGENAREERLRYMHEFDAHPSLLRRSACFERKIHFDDMPKKVLMRGSAYGLWQPYINDNTPKYRLMPGTMEKRKEYQELDITEYIHKGENNFKLLLANGWHNCECFGILDAKELKLICEIEAVYEDGRTVIYGTDESWQVYPSSLYEDDLQYGERYDARIDESTNAVPCEVCSGETQLVLQDYPKIAVTATKVPVKAWEETGRVIYEFDKNYSGRAMIKLKNTRPGQKIILRYYEFINKDGRYNLQTYTDVFYPAESDENGKSRYSVKNIDVYICKGADEEIYEPVFTYTGYKYVIVYGLDSINQCELSGNVINADLERNASLKTSYSFIEGLWDMTYNSWIGNVYSGPTDCPSREKNYWNGDIQIFSHAACWCSDVYKLLSVWTTYGRKLEYDVYGWEDEEYILPMTLYKFYGKKEILENKYKDMLELIDFRMPENGAVLPVNPRSPYRDHLTCGVNIDSLFFAHIYYCYMLKSVAEISGIISQSDKQKELDTMYKTALCEFRKRYLESELLWDNQAALILCVSFGLLDPDNTRRAADKIAQMIKDNGYRLGTGFHASRYLLELLCDFGYPDVAWHLVKQREYPSWRYIMDSGSATYTEDWHGLCTGESTLSMNHFTLGAFTGWFFEYLGGIRINKSSPGLDVIWLEPLFIKEIGDLSVCANTVHGQIKSGWKYENDTVRYSFTVPQNTTVRLCINDKITEYTAGEYTIEI